VEPISVAQFTDVTDYYLLCAPSDIESIEVGFVNGREEPELLLQDRPDAGQVFTNDQMSFKVRWEFGGGWLDSGLPGGVLESGGGVEPGSLRGR